MVRPEEPQHIVSRGLLTESEREFLRGEKDVENPDGYRYNVRSRFRDRMDELEKDLEILDEAGEDDLLATFYSRFGRVERLEQEVERLQAKVDEEDDDERQR